MPAVTPWFFLTRVSQRLALPAVSGLLSTLAFPKADQHYLAWIALVPLVIFLRLSSSSGEAFRGGFLAGFIQFFGLLIWMPAVLSHYGNLPVPLAWLLYSLLAAFLASFPGCACAITRYCMGRRSLHLLFVFPAAWVATEYARNYIPFGGFPWLLIGYSQTECLRLIQVSDFLGVYGVSFLLLWINTALGWAFCAQTGMRKAYAPLVAGILLTACCLAYGDLRLRRWRGADPGLTTAMLQGNLRFDEPEEDLARKFQEGYVRMADRLTESKIDLLVLPESPSPLIFQHNTAYRETLERLAARYSLGLIFNNISVSVISGEERYFNSAYFLNGDGKELGRYDKVHLVPFGEYIPWRRLFFFAETITKDVSDFYPGEALRVIPMRGQPVNVLICFEAVFPQLAREFVRRGSRLIVNLTNDGWYGDSAAPYQHLAMARWRAVENRRYLLRATNSGISAIVSPTGEILARTGLLREEICNGRFAFIAERSWYTRLGDVFAILCVIITCVAPVFLTWRKFVTANKPEVPDSGG